MIVAVALAGVLGTGAVTAATATAAPRPSTTATPPAGALVVGAASASCTAPGFATISDAVAAATPGATVYVCAGTYDEKVTVTEPLRLLGAQFGRDARTGRTDPAQESVVGSGTGAFAITAGVDGVTIDGFSLTGSGTDSTNGDGIDAFDRGAGHTFVNNVIADNTNGMNINSNGSAPTLVRHNRFTDNNRTGDQGGNGVVLTSGPANDVLVSENAFEGHGSAAFNSVGDGSNWSIGLVFRSNTSVDDSSLAVINNASGARVENNTATKDPALSGTGIYIVGNTDGLVVRGNRITGGAGTGISANAAFGSAPSTDLTIEANLIKDRANGIRVTGAHKSATIRLNGVFTSNGTGPASGYGIDLGPDTDGLVVAKNVVLGSSTLDCRDQSAGVRPANLWLLTIGLTSSPTGLCLPGRIPVGAPGDPGAPHDPGHGEHPSHGSWQWHHDDDKDCPWQGDAGR